MELAAITGQNNLGTRLASPSLCATWLPGVIKPDNGSTIKAKIHAKSGMIANRSIIALGVGPLKAVRDAARDWRVL
jgi:hypothetical protein